MKHLAFRGYVAAAALAMSGVAFGQTVNFANNTALTAAQQAQIIQAQQQALTAVQNALAYLQAVGPSVVTGTNTAYNANLGQFFDQSLANPIRGTYASQLNKLYGSANLTALGPGISTTSRFTFTGTVLQNQFSMTHTGTLQNPPALAYVRPSTSLYGTGSTSLAIGSISTTMVPTTAPTTSTGSGSSGSSGSTTTPQVDWLLKDPPLGGVISTGGSGSSSSGSTSGNQDLPIYNITGANYSLAAGTTGPTILSAALHKIDTVGDAVDPSRYTQMISLLTSLRNALAGTVTYNGDLETNRVAIFNALNTTVGSNTRGFEQYGYSTSDSNLKQAADLARLINPSLNPLSWYQDTGARVGGLLTGALLPGERNNFFQDKFTILSTNGTVYIGQSALNGSQQANNGLFDSSNRQGQTQSTLPLYQQIIEAFAAGLTQGSRTAQYGLNEINTANGNVNSSTYTTTTIVAGVPVTTTNTAFFPQDRDVNAIMRFITNPAVQAQASNPTGATNGKVGFAAGNINPAFTIGGLIVPLN